MPGQDERSRINEQEAVYAAERDKQRAERIQQAKQEQRTADSGRIVEPVKADKLLPFLNAAHERYTARIVSLNSKKQTRLSKIAKNVAKEERLSAKADRLSVTNEMLRRLSAGTKLETVANAVVERNQRRIDKIRNEKIPKIEDKIAAHGEKVLQLDKKIAAQQRKADKCTALSNVITSFVMLNPEKRRAQFSQSMDTLHRVTKESLAAKAEKYQDKVSEIRKRLETENLSQASYDRLVKQMNTNLDKIQETKAKLQKLDAVTKPYTEQTAEHQDMMQAFTEKQLDTAAERGEIRINPLTETLCINAAERAAERSERVFEQMQVHPEQPPSAEQELAELLEKTGYQQVFDNAFAQDGFIVLRAPDGKEIGFDGAEMAVEHLKQHTAVVREMTAADFQELGLETIERNPNIAAFQVNEHESGDQSWRSYDAIYQKDGHFYEHVSDGWDYTKDTYREISPEKAKEIISAHQKDPEWVITDIGLQALNPPRTTIFSIEQNGETRYYEANRTDIDAVIDAAKADHPMIAAENIGKRISEARYAEIEQSDKLSASVSVNVNLGFAQVYEINHGKGGIREEDRTEQNVRISTETLTSIQKFNPEYFKTIPRADRLTDTRTHEAAMKIMDELNQQGIPCSAVFRNNGTASVTVNQKQHGAVYLSVLRSVGEPLPAQQKQQDITVRTPEAAARITSALDNAGIPNSHVSRGNGTVIVTDAQDRPQVNAVISNTEQEHRKQFINPETYKQIPKDERFTKRMPEAEARAAVDQLAAKGVPHSAVLNGDRSAVTVEKKSKGFVLGKLQRDNIASRAAQAKHQPVRRESTAKQHDLSD